MFTTNVDRHVCGGHRVKSRIFPDLSPGSLLNSGPPQIQLFYLATLLLRTPALLSKLALQGGCNITTFKVYIN